MTLAAFPLSDVDRFMLASKAVHSVRCPKCPAPAGSYCQSTGGGNFAHVAVHKAREERIADYVGLHKIVTGLNARVIWQHLVDGNPLDELVAPLPDEFHPWCRQVAGDLAATVDQRAAELEKAYADLVAGLADGFTRKEFAAVAVPHPEKWAMFLLLDGRDIRPELWKRAKPEPFLTPSGRTYGEDTA